MGIHHQGTEPSTAQGGIPCLQTPGIDIFFVKQKTYFPKAKNSKKINSFSKPCWIHFFCWGGVVDEYPAMRQMLQVFIANRETRSHPFELLCAQGYFGIARRWRQGEREATGLKGKQQEIYWMTWNCSILFHLGHWTRLKKNWSFLDLFWGTLGTLGKDSYFQEIVDKWRKLRGRWVQVRTRIVTPFVPVFFAATSHLFPN